MFKRCLFFRWLLNPSFYHRDMDWELLCKIVYFMQNKEINTCKKYKNVNAARLVNYQKICDLQAWSSALLIKPSNFPPEIERSKILYFIQNLKKVFATRGVIKIQNITTSVIFLRKFSTHEKIGIRSLNLTGENKYFCGGGQKREKNRLPCNECPLQ